MTDGRAAVGTDTNPNWPGAAPLAVGLERTRVAMPVEIDPRAAILRNPLSARAASFRVLRHRLAERGDPKVILVTSALDGEGKTTCALNLALALAESGRHRVLLLEANTRRPALASLLGFAPPACFLEQLTQRRTDPARSWKVAQLPTHDLDVLAAQARSEPRAPMHGPTLIAALASLRAAYDYTVVDTSSIITGLDVPVAEDAADGLVLTARTRQTRGRDLKIALGRVGVARVLGVALIDG